MNTPTPASAPALFVSVPLALFRELVSAAEVGEAEAGYSWMRDTLEEANALTPAPLTPGAHAAQLLAVALECFHAVSTAQEISIDTAIRLRAAIESANGSTQPAPAPFSPQEAFNDALLHASLEQLRAQRDTLQNQADELAALVRAFPAQLTSARLDAREGKQTPYDYAKAFNACAPRIPVKSSTVREREQANAIPPGSRVSEHGNPLDGPIDPKASY